MLCSTLLIALSLPAEAQIYKYRLPNGKLLFTDTEIFKPGHTLLNPKKIKRSKPAYRYGYSKPSKFQPEIRYASRAFGVEESLIKAIIKTESDFNPDAVSRAGAQGLMQLMPKLAKNYKVKDSFNSKQNIMAGTEHIKYLLKVYKGNLRVALAAYNAGETQVNKYGGIPPFSETKRYVKKVIRFKSDYES